MKSTCLFLLLICCGQQLVAQVDEIKGASSSNSSRSSGKSDGGSYDSDDGGGGIFFDFLFGGIVEAQSFKLQSDKQRYPSMVSLDVMFQGAVKPSSYYMIWPRIRGNWGLFSTDFRMNYLIEESAEGYIHIRTNDWQVIQLNLITSRFFTFRVGTGFMQEAFNTKEMFSESAFMFLIHAPDQTKTLGFEYRFSKDWDTGANPRREFSVQYQHQLFNTGILHGYATAGCVYQKYYNSIEVWGVQAGLVFRLF
jgi:hypothetical protein